MRALLVDDDPDFRLFATHALTKAGVEHAVAESAEEGLELLAQQPGHYDVILLDLVLPDRSGWDLLHELREKGDEIPVIFITVRDDVSERVKGLRMGADDFLVKPIEIEELVARMEAVLRRRRELVDIDYGDLHVSLARRKVIRGGHPVDLSPREYDLLLALLRGRGETVTREHLLQEVWDMRFDPSTNVLDVHIGRLRRKLDRHGRPAIQTVRGQGYQLVRHAPEPSA